jgi:hypothetical protein
MDWIQKEINTVMKRALILMLVTASCLFAQDGANEVHYQTAGPVHQIAFGGFIGTAGATVQGAPYSANTTNKFIQTLPDGNQIVQTSSGTVARDSQGRTRQDAPLPPMSDPSAEPPHLVFIQDPVTHTSYVLNLTDKTAQKTPMPANTAGASVARGEHGAIFMRTEVPGISNGSSADNAIFVRHGAPGSEQAVTEDLGTQTMEGVRVTGVRATQTVPAGQMGNAKPFTIVNEVWTSPDLETVIYSKRTDPLAGEMVYQLTNLVRSEPDSSLFTIPADFQIVDGPKAIAFGPNRE